MIILVEAPYTGDYKELKEELSKTALPIYDIKERLPLMDFLPELEKLSISPIKKINLPYANNKLFQEIRSLYEAFFELRLNNKAIDDAYLEYRYKGFVEGIPRFLKRYDRRLAKEFAYVANLKRISILDVLEKGIILPLHPFTASYLYAKYKRTGHTIIAINERLQRWPTYREVLVSLKYIF